MRNAYQPRSWNELVIIATPPKKFEEALENLEGLVEKLDTGELSLLDSLQAVEDGVALVHHLEAELT